jgi:hypothetical protein
MKKIALLLISIPALLCAQNNKPIANFYLENNSVIYHHVFKDSLDSASVIIQKLLAQLPVSPNINNLKEFKNGAVLTGTYEAQYANEGSPWEMIKGYFIIEVKNGRYRVTISNILDNKNSPIMPFSYLYAKNNPLEWRSSVQNDLNKLDAKFTETFKFNTAKTDW